MKRRGKRSIRAVSWVLFMVVCLLLCGQSSNSANRIETEAGVAMVLIRTGEMMMGGLDGMVDEQPPHQLRISSYYIDTCEVTQEEFERLMAENPSRWKDPRRPVERVRWSDAIKYCNARSLEEGLQPCYDLETWQCDFSANGYRLPTEAEWEYACRAGSKTSYFFGEEKKKLTNFAWFDDNSVGMTRPVGTKLPNPWGLYDMYGNVAEWCNDFYQVDYYKESPPQDPRGAPSSETRVVRDGSWNSPAERCRSAFRDNEDPGYADVCFGYEIYGFRVVRNAN